MTKGTIFWHFSVYNRPFRNPLQTHHGLWRSRQGIILEFQDHVGQISQGEIAPLPWFGTETLDAAIAFCQTLPQQLTLEIIQQIPPQFPACQFGFESAWEGLFQPWNYPENSTYCSLLPAQDTLNYLQQELEQGIKTFKRKIAIAPITQEIEHCESLLEQMPADGKLRLDANGGLTLEQAKTWLKWGQNGDRLEFIEQPLSPDQFIEMLHLQEQFTTAIALDESVANLTQLQQIHDQDWQGIYIIKAAIMGFPSQLRKFCQTHAIDTVFSTVFETEIGQKVWLNLATECGNPQRALGFGGHDYFA